MRPDDQGISIHAQLHPATIFRGIHPRDNRMARMQPAQPATTITHVYQVASLRFNRFQPAPAISAPLATPPLP